MTISETSRPFLWDEANFTWDSPYAGKSWDTAAISRYALTQDEPLHLADRTRIAIAICDRARLALSESTHRRIVACQQEHPLLTDRLTSAARYERTRTHTISLAERSSRKSCRTFTDSLTLTEQDARRITLRRTVALPLTDEHLPRTVQTRTLTERAALTERSARANTRTFTDTLALTDARLAPYRGTLSDITFTPHALTDDLWQKSATSPVGYGSFHPFEVGEYTYRDALVRLLLTTGAAGAQPLLYDVALCVDIEDVREHGLAECTSDAPTRITLTRHYYQRPRIALTVIGADTSAMPIPHLISQDIDNDSHTFDCELRTADGKRIGGTVSYLAEGY